MKKTSILLTLAILTISLCSCTTNTLTMSDGTKWTRTSCFQQVQIPKLSVEKKDGTKIKLEGYSNDGGATVAGAVVEAAVKAAVTSVK